MDSNERRGFNRVNKFSWAFKTDEARENNSRQELEQSSRENVPEQWLFAAYQPRHNSEVQLIIRRQIHSGISGVSHGYEI